MNVEPISKLRSRRMTKRETDRPKCEGHLRWVRTLPCCVSGAPSGVIVHHCMHGDPSATGARSSDRHAVPLLHSLHDAQYAGALHREACEPVWWAARGIDPLALAARLWAISIAAGRWQMPSAAERIDAARHAGDWETWVARGYRAERVAA